MNRAYNQATGEPVGPGFLAGDAPQADQVIAPRINGDFTGTTGEILRWAACKWGIDQDIVFAQAAVESWWRQDHAGRLGEQRAARPATVLGRRQARPVPAELGHPAEPVPLRARQLAGDRDLHRDERGHRVCDLAVLLRRLRDVAEHGGACGDVPGRRRVGLRRPLVRRALAHRPGAAVHRPRSRSTCASGSGSSPTSRSPSPPHPPPLRSRRPPGSSTSARFSRNPASRRPFLSQFPAHARATSCRLGSGAPAWRIAAMMIWRPEATIPGIGGLRGGAAMIPRPGRRQNVRDRC